MRSARNSRRTKMPLPQVMMAPLIDVVFLLLIFFMLVTKFLAPSISVDLPKSVSADIREERAIHLGIDNELNLFIGEEKRDWASLVDSLIAAKDADNPQIVRIKADKSVPIEYVVRVIDAVREAGLKTVALEAETPNPSDFPASESSDKKDARKQRNSEDGDEHL